MAQQIGISFSFGIPSILCLVLCLQTACHRGGKAQAPPPPLRLPLEGWSGTSSAC